MLKGVCRFLLGPGPLGPCLAFGARSLFVTVGNAGPIVAARLTVGTRAGQQVVGL
ncbi:MAG: hypothetical protein KKA73_20830 [Chloroflexi bacterium]|nr:hypothetical protein [Chloroflexota bacterium]